MKYTMVKQFSNAAIDNIFIFFWKIVDFGKLMIEVFWGIFDIFAAFFLIFYNFGMYIYYLFLFVIDRGSESGGPVTMATRSRSSARSKIPTVGIDTSPTPIPAMFRVKTPSSISANSVSSTVSSTISSTAAVASKTTETVQKVLAPVKSSPSGAGAKKNIVKTIMEFFADIFIAIKDMIAKPFIVISDFMSGKLKPVRESEVKEKEAGGKGGLIDEYLKEYEKQRKKAR